jgi:tRNA A58 N-methylase Trm61
MLYTLYMARVFSAKLRDEIGIENMHEVVRRNRVETTNACHTHDFCDANQVLLDALEADNVTLDLNDPRAVEFMNEVWAEAKENEFFIGGLQ